MEDNVNLWIQLFLRWAHIVAGITWIGHLYFFNWVNGPFQAKIDGPTKKLINPELLPRALFWFRWGAAWTWFTGILLAVLIYYHVQRGALPLVLFEEEYARKMNPWLWLAIVLVLLAIGFLIYNFIMKALANKVVAAALCLVIFAGVYLFLECVGHFSSRALYIHVGAIFGTMMALNVWMIIWPKQKQIITALKAGTPLAADSPEVKIAGLRSRHNTYMSVPLVLSMISMHFPNAFSQPPLIRDLLMAGFIALGFFVVWLLYKKAAKVPGI